MFYSIVRSWCVTSGSVTAAQSFLEYFFSFLKGVCVWCCRIEVLGFWDFGFGFCGKTLDEHGKTRLNKHWPHARRISNVDTSLPTLEKRLFSLFQDSYNLTWLNHQQKLLHIWHGLRVAVPATHPNLTWKLKQKPLGSFDLKP